jgi:hypothetical protein
MKARVSPGGAIDWRDHPFRVPNTINEVHSAAAARVDMNQIMNLYT